MGLDIKQTKELIVRPLLDSLGLGGDDAVNLVTGTALVESGMQFVKQVNGPALGICQMEPNTFNDCVVNYLNYRDSLKNSIIQHTGSVLLAEDMIWNLNLSFAMCRIKYLRSPVIIPNGADGSQLAQLHKTIYNTSLGKADPVINTHLFEEVINA